MSLTRALLSLEGLSVGDAFGERFFATDPRVRLARAIARRPPDDTPRSVEGGAITWKWTDDTAMAISIVEELALNSTIFMDSLAVRFGLSYRREPDRGYGSTAHTILGEIAAGAPWREAAQAPYGGTGSKGNGGAMRAAPIGAFFDSVDVVVEEAERSAAPTHAHPEGVAGAIAIAVAACVFNHWSVARDDLWNTVLSNLPNGAVRDNVEKASMLPSSMDPEDVAEAIGSGQEVLAEDTVGYCLWCAHRGVHLGYEVALYETVRGMGDIDTNCAIVGGLLALVDDGKSIPQEWKQKREPLPSSVSSSSSRSA